MIARDDEATPARWRDLWRMMNLPRAFDPRTVRIACTVLCLAYGAIALSRYDPRHPELMWIRLVIMAHATAGVALARRFTWIGLRAWTVTLAIVLSLGTGWVSGTLGNGISELALTALGTFVPLVFVQSGRDFLLAGAALAGGHTLLLAWFPPPLVELRTVGIVLGASVATGTAAGLILVVYRARLAQSLSWWQEACARERALREFAEVTSGHLGRDGLLDQLAEHFRRTMGDDGRCSIALATRDGSGFQIVATAGFVPTEAARLMAEPLPPPVAALLADTIASRRVFVRPDLPAAVRQDIERRWRRRVSARCLVALPLLVEDVVAGAVVLSAPTPRTITPEEQLSWQAMANALGIALANAQLLDRLRAALRAKSEFLNTMSHELRSPLHVVIGYTDMVREEGVPERAVRALDRVRASALELLQLVENTMNAARLEAGKVALQVESFAPQDLARDLAESVGALPEACHGVPVRWDVSPDLPRVRLDRLKLKEIVQNLISNALKFTPVGEVRVSMARAGDRLRIAVRDTGVGIPLDAQPRVFGMFERIEHENGTRSPGAGLGLYIVGRLTELMRGRTSLESEPGAGSCFTVELPLSVDA
jgi:signal transduction histidine kinase